MLNEEATMITRTEQERTRRAKVALDAWDRYETLSDRSRMLAVVDALDLLDNEDEASFKGASLTPRGTPLYPEVDTTRKPPLNDHGIGAFVEKHTKKPKHPAVQAQFEGKPLPEALSREVIRDRELRSRPDLYDTLDEANNAPEQDWSFFKGLLLGVAMSAAFVLAYQAAVLYYD